MNTEIKEHELINKGGLFVNVLVINGSPKGQRSNTFKLAKAFLDGAGYTDADIIDVSKLNIKPCLGCFTCWEKTPGKCVISDDMPSLLDKIISADIIVWTFPLYYFSVPGGLKNVIDRQLPMNLPFMAADSETGAHPSHYDLSHQRHVVISTCGFWTSKGNYEAVDAQFSHIYDSNGFTAIYCGQGELFRVPELSARTEEYLSIVSQAGAEFASGQVSPDTLEQLAQPLFPREVFEQMADASWSISEGGTAPDESFSFTKQMAALYHPDGNERVIEFAYTDIGKAYQIVCTPNGHEVISDSFKPYTTRIETPFTVWKAIARGEITGQDALFQRKYTVIGDFDLMLHWDELFGSQQAPKKEQKANTKRETNMAILLAPWIVLWTAVAINAAIGSMIGIISAAALPVIWLKFEDTLYERLTVLIVCILSVALLYGIDANIVLPLSYLVFGIIWFVSGFAKIPLTAWYSKNGYGGEKAFDNPLFLRTNQILTQCWGVLYIITPIWTYYLMKSPAAAFTGLINSACPAIMSLFTAWFQKWYPKRYAVGKPGSI